MTIKKYNYFISTFFPSPQQHRGEPSKAQKYFKRASYKIEVISNNLAELYFL